MKRRKAATNAPKNRCKTAFCVGVLAFGSMLSCTRSYNEEDLTAKTQGRADSIKKAQDARQEKLMQTNRVLLRKENERIVSYFERRGWKMSNRRGVWIQVTKSGGGGEFKEDEKIRAEYSLGLLNGKRLSGNDAYLFAEFTVGKASEYPQGLQMALEAAREGEAMRLIVPYNLAYGLSGDGNGIPSSASLVYEIKNIERVR